MTLCALPRSSVPFAIEQSAVFWPFLGHTALNDWRRGGDMLCCDGLRIIRMSREMLGGRYEAVFIDEELEFPFDIGEKVANRIWQRRLLLPCHSILWSV